MPLYLSWNFSDLELILFVQAAQASASDYLFQMASKIKILLLEAYMLVINIGTRYSKGLFIFP